MKVKDIMTPSSQMINADASVTQAAQMMKSINAGVLPVKKSQAVNLASDILGIVTDRDIVLRCLALGSSPEKTFVGDIMTSGVVFCLENDDIEDAVKTMEDNHIDCLLVLNTRNQAVGTLSLGDIALKTGDETLTAELTEKLIHHHPPET